MSAGTNHFIPYRARNPNTASTTSTTKKVAAKLVDTVFWLAASALL